MFKRKKTSAIWLYTKEQVQIYLNSSNTLAEALDKMQVTNITAGYGALKRRIEEESLDVSHIKLGTSSNRGRKHRNHFRATDNEVFCKDSLVARVTLKRYLRKRTSYQCSGCQNTGSWMNKNLSLQVDHINGRNNDNRIENLRFLCPNCHSQTENFGSKNKNRSKVGQVVAPHGEETQDCIGQDAKLN